VTDRLTIDQGTLRAFDGNGRQLWTYGIGGGSLNGPFILNTGAGERRTAVYDAGSGMLHLAGRNGTAVKGFPRRSGPYFNAGRVTNKSTWNLILTEDDTYLNNYELITGSK